MKQSKYFIPTSKQTPSDAQIASHQILLQGGYVKQTAAGIYSFLPLGYTVLKKIEQIIREEMEAIDAYEVFMPVLQPEQLWQESGRWDEYGSMLMRMQDCHERTFALGPTHEEVVTDIVRDFVKTYKKLPFTLYQIQTKFRDELRPRFGLMRGREFMMMDAYSFSTNQADLDAVYANMEIAYRNILTRLDLNFRQVSALAGEIAGAEAESAEFMALSSIGEDTIVYSDTSDFAANIEVYPDMKEGDASPDGQGKICFAKGIEVGHIFKLGTKYSEALNATVTMPDGTLAPIIMGCYGIGVSRLVMAVMEQHQTDNKLVWPISVAPFKVHILVANIKNEEQLSTALTIYQALKDKHVEVLLDERDERLGTKFADAELIGAPLCLVVGKGVERQVVELQNKLVNETTEVVIPDVVNTIVSLLER